MTLHIPFSPPRRRFNGTVAMIVAAVLAAAVVACFAIAWVVVEHVIPHIGAPLAIGGLVAVLIVAAGLFAGWATRG